MSAVRAAKSFTSESGIDAVAMPQGANSTLEAMQDVLYDILANGIDPDQTEVSTPAVEQFLFEHARAPKTLPEFQAFFAAQGLTVRTASPLAKAAVSLPPLLPRAPKSDDMPVQLPVELQLAAPAPRPMPVESPIAVEITSEAPPPPRRKPVYIALWAGLAVLGAMLAAAASYGHATITRLEKELDRAAQEGRDNRAGLEVLRHDAVGLESSVAATGELVKRVDQKSDLLIESLLPPEGSARPTAKRPVAKTVP